MSFKRKDNKVIFFNEIRKEIKMKRGQKSSSKQ